MLKRSGIGLGMLGLAGVLADDGEFVCREQSQCANRGQSAGGQGIPLSRESQASCAFLSQRRSVSGRYLRSETNVREICRQAAAAIVSHRAENRAAHCPPRSSFKNTAKAASKSASCFHALPLHVDDIAVIRSMYAQVPNHEPSLMLMNCGDSVQPRPSVGSWVLYGLGTENQNLPGFIAMCPKGLPMSDNANWRSGFLPGMYQGTYIDPQYRQIDRLIENITSPHATTEMQRRQLDFLQR